MKINGYVWTACGIAVLFTMTETVEVRGQHAIDMPAAPVPVSRPAWVVGDIPVDVWMLVEKAVAAADDDMARRLLTEAESLARNALAGNEQNADRRFALAVVLGARTEYEGGRTKVRLAVALADEVRAALMLDPEHAGAHYLMGRLHAAVRRMNGVTRWVATTMLGGGMLGNASWAQAEEHLSFAEGHAPSVPDHHLQLAQLYRDTDRPQLALLELGHVLDLDARSPLEFLARGEALALIAELEQHVGSNPPHPM